TPGLVMTTTAFVESHKNAPTRDDIRKAHAGNLCRCTGYDTIVTAVEKSLRHEEALATEGTAE
ncbi:MAG: 2Fe-2S iron-sulfur cluster-binding protein, partial [Bilophila sp.]